MPKQSTSYRHMLNDGEEDDINYAPGTCHWHVMTQRMVCTPSPDRGKLPPGYPEPEDVCEYQAKWSPVASFSNVAQPVPPKPVKPPKRARPKPAKAERPHLSGRKFCGWRKFTVRNTWTFKAEPGSVHGDVRQADVVPHRASQLRQVSYSAKPPHRAQMGGYRCKRLHHRWEYSDMRCEEGATVWRFASRPESDQPPRAPRERCPGERPDATARAITNQGGRMAHMKTATRDALDQGPWTTLESRYADALGEPVTGARAGPLLSVDAGETPGEARPVR